MDYYSLQHTHTMHRDKWLKLPSATKYYYAIVPVAIEHLWQNRKTRTEKFTKDIKEATSKERDY